MAHQIRLTDPVDGHVLTDREIYLSEQERVQQDQLAMDQVLHYQALGVGLAALACNFYDALVQDPMHRFGREEILRLLVAVVTGR